MISVMYWIMTEITKQDFVIQQNGITYKYGKNIESYLMCCLHMTKWIIELTK